MGSKHLASFYVQTLASFFKGRRNIQRTTQCFSKKTRPRKLRPWKQSWSTCCTIRRWIHIDLHLHTHILQGTNHCIKQFTKPCHIGMKAHSENIFRTKSDPPPSRLHLDLGLSLTQCFPWLCHTWWDNNYSHGAQSWLNELLRNLGAFLIGKHQPQEGWLRLVSQWGKWEVNCFNGVYFKIFLKKIEAALSRTLNRQHRTKLNKVFSHVSVF